MNLPRRMLVPAILLAITLFFSVAFKPAYAASPPAPNPQSGSLGVEGQVKGAPPSQAATITIPRNGQNFTSSPITVSGLCPKGTLVEIFDNGIFVGSVQCTNGSFSLEISLFDGRNDLVARVFDALDQAGPDSNTVTVTFNAALPGGGTRPSLTTAYAKRGANPGDNLTWPITLSGGKGPYSISIDWGDKTPLDLINRQNAGSFNIEHIYAQAGIYNVTIKATDANGTSAFLQVVAISNGPIQQAVANSQGGTTTKVEHVIIWWPLVVLFVLSIIAFWLGKRHQLQTIRDRLHHGERPI